MSVSTPGLPSRDVEIEVAAGRAPRGRRGASVGDIAFVLPALVLVGFLLVLPVATAIVGSFRDWEPGYSSPFIGLDNYRELFASPIFREVLRNEFFYLLGLPLWVLLPLAMAYLVNERVPAASVFRSIFFFPAILSPAIVAVLFVFMLGPNGPLNSALRAVGLDFMAFDWLADATVVKPTIIVVLLWAGLGTGVVIFSAGLAALPPEQLEAARIDGASTVQELRYIVVPALRPLIVLYAVMQVINVFLWSFPWIYVLTAGGPGYSSATLDYDIYQNTLAFSRFGLGAAEMVVLMAVVAITVTVGGVAMRLIGKST